MLARPLLICLFCLDVRVDDDIKAQIAALVKKQKERDADRARSSSTESVRLAPGTSGGPSPDELEKIIDKRVSGLFALPYLPLTRRLFTLQFKSLEGELRAVTKAVKANTSQSASSLKKISSLIEKQTALYAAATKLTCVQSLLVF